MITNLIDKIHEYTWVDATYRRESSIAKAAYKLCHVCCLSPTSPAHDSIQIDRHGMIDLDLHLFEEGLQSLMEESGGNLSLADDDIYLLWDDALAMSPTMAPEEENPLINAEDFEAAMGMHPPS